MQPPLCQRHSWKAVSFFQKYFFFSFFILKCFLMRYWHILGKRSRSSSTSDFSDIQVCCLLRSVSDFWNFKDNHFSIYLISSEWSDEGYSERAAWGQRQLPHGAPTLQAPAEPTLPPGRSQSHQAAGWLHHTDLHRPHCHSFEEVLCHLSHLSLAIIQADCILSYPAWAQRGYSLFSFNISCFHEAEQH